MEPQKFFYNNISFSLLDPDSSTLRETIPGYSYEPSVCSIIKNILNKEKVATFLDIGSLYGYFAILVSKLSPNASIHAFEPNPSYLATLKNNIDINGGKILCHELALSDKKEQLNFKGKTLTIQAINKEPVFQTIFRTIKSIKNTNHHSGNSKISKEPIKSSLQWVRESIKHVFKSFLGGDKATQEIQVPCLPYDQWKLENKVKATIAKIDVHGAEVKVLRGMRDSLKNDLQYVLLEVHAKHMLVEGTYKEIYEILNEAGFFVYEIADFRKNEKPIFVSLVGNEYERFVNPEMWTLKENIEMRMLYACKDKELDFLS